MVTSILPKFLTFKWDWHIEVSDGSFFSFFMLFHLNLTFFEWSLLLNIFEVNFQNLKFRHRLTASNLDTFFSGMLKISPGGLLMTLVYVRYAYEGSNSDSKIWVYQNCISEFQSMMPIPYPKIWVPNCVFKTRILSPLAQNVLYQLRNDFKPN